jgi:hypothetical protein
MIQSLCETCLHKKEVVSAKGSRFLLCRLSQNDRRFAKYPPQPVVKCVAYTELTGDQAQGKPDGEL